MKKINFLIAAMAALVTFTMSACSDDDDTSSNIERYQQSVDKTVKNTKDHDKAILLVAFGSTWQQAFETFDNTKVAYEEEFGDEYDIYMSFSSVICINRAAAGEHSDEGAEIRNYYSPSYWLEAFGRVEYEEIIVQSLQVTPGEEYGRVVNFTKDFLNNSYRDLDEDYLEEVQLGIGVPLLQDAEDDVEAVAYAINENLKDYAAKGVVALMGHGNPDDYDTYKANVRYTQLEEALQEINPNYFVGTVDMEDNYKMQVLERIEEAGFEPGTTIYITPLMTIAGDHAHNDLAGDDGEEYTKEELMEMDDEDLEEVSWKVYFSKFGYECNDNTVIMKGLLDYANLRSVWIEHTYDAM